MNVFNDLLTNFNLFLDGNNYLGQVKSMTPPDLEKNIEQFRANFDASVAVRTGMKELSGSFMMINYNLEVLKLFGFEAGSVLGLTFRAAKEQVNGTVIPVEIYMNAEIISLKRGSWEPGQIPPLDVAYQAIEYKETHGQEVLFDIDIPNFRQIVNGKDLLAGQAAALGIR